MSTDTHHRLLFENSPDAILIIESDRFVDCNAAAAKMLRFPTKEALLSHYAERAASGVTGSGGAHPADMSPPFQPDGRDSREKADEILERTFREGSQTFEWEHLCADGESLLVEVQLTVIRRGERPLIASTWRDISERKRLEGERQEAQRLEAVGRLAGGIAHDFNNLLVVIISNAQFLIESIEAGTPDTQDAKEILEASHRASDLTRQLLAFSRGQVSQGGVVELDLVVGGLTDLLQRLIGEHIEFAFTQAGESLAVQADAIQIEQIVLNLAANARDAMPDGGCLSIDVRPDEEAHERVVLTVRDTGIGMSPELIDQAFDPFFTTKPAGRGTGLGLATVRKIVEDRNGEIAISAEPGVGTTVRVSLPRVSAEDEEAMSKPPRAPGAGAGESILLVEDEAAIRKLMTRQLESAGYRVTTAVDGQDALDRLGEASPLDLLVTDVVMPRLSGPELARRLRAEQPDLPVLFMSGYSEGDDLALIEELGRTNRLQKPFAPSDLRAEVAEILWLQRLADEAEDD